VNEPRRRRAFVWVPAVVAGAAALLFAINAIGGEQRRNLAPESRKAVPRLVAARPLAGREREAEGRISLAQARERGRAFVRAFLRYQRGDASSRTATLLARTASAGVRRYLTSAPSRPADDASRARVHSLGLYGPEGGRVKVSALLAYRGKGSLFEFVLERRHGDWRVTELYP
jgi:hypothetical protein